MMAQYFHKISVCGLVNKRMNARFTAKRGTTTWQLSVFPNAKKQIEISDVSCQPDPSPDLPWDLLHISASICWKTRCGPRTRMLTRISMVQMSKHIKMQLRKTPL
jgi:hypothetical protein